MKLLYPVDATRISIYKTWVIKLFGKYQCDIHDGKAYLYKEIIYVVK